MRGWKRASTAAPWFDGENFSLVDAVFGPVFRYFDVFDDIGDFGILAGKPKLARWRAALAARPSVNRCRQSPTIRRGCATSSTADSWHLAVAGAEWQLDQISVAIFASIATVFMLRAVPLFAAGMTSLDFPMPSP